MNSQKISADDKLTRIQKREKAKNRSSEEVKKKIKRTSDFDDKKAIQMIRNRISAQNSRDRKKAYIQHLEEKARQQLMENQDLKNEIEDLQKEESSLTRQQNKIKRQLSLIETVKFQNNRIGKIGLTLLTLVSVFSIMGKQVEETAPVKMEINFDKGASMFSDTYFDTKSESEVVPKMPEFDEYRLEETYNAYKDPVSRKQSNYLFLGDMELEKYLSSS